MALLKNDFFSIERKESNNLPHRKIRLEDVILKYQTNQSELSEEDFAKQRDKVFAAIDEVTVDLDMWQTDDKYAYFRMDLRRYKEVTDVNIDDEGRAVCMIAPEFTEDMKGKPFDEAYYDKLFVIFEKSESFIILSSLFLESLLLERLFLPSTSSSISSLLKYL